MISIHSRSPSWGLVRALVACVFAAVALAGCVEIIDAIGGDEGSAAQEPEQPKKPPFCDAGPPLLRNIDATELAGGDPRVLWRNPAFSANHVAEWYIGACSRDLGLLRMTHSYQPSYWGKATISIWESNLEFMKWWLQNRQVKGLTPPDATGPTNR
jgi:hypothetical protein